LCYYTAVLCWVWKRFTMCRLTPSKRSATCVCPFWLTSFIVAPSRVCPSRFSSVRTCSSPAR
jgi:hypothetical protein